MSQVVETPESVTALTGTSAGPFSTNFGYADPDEVVVSIVAADGTTVQLTRGNDYTLTPSGTTLVNGGGITLLGSVIPSGGWNGQRLLRARLTPAGQPADMQDTQGFKPSTVEYALNKLTRITQELRAQASRVLRMPLGEPGATLPPDTVRAGKIAEFDSKGRLVAFRSAEELAISISPAQLQAAVTTWLNTRVGGGVHNGFGSPADTLGQDKDWYLDKNDNGVVWVKSGGSWLAKHFQFSGASEAIDPVSGYIGRWRIADYDATKKAIKNQASANALSASLLRYGKRAFTDTNIFNANGATFVDVPTSIAFSDGSACSTESVPANNLGLSASLPLAAGTYTAVLDVERNAASDQTFKMRVDTSSNLANVSKTAGATKASVSVTFTLAADDTVAIYPTSCLGGSSADLKIDDFRLFAGSSDLGTQILSGHIYLGRTNGKNEPTQPVYASGELDFGSVAPGGLGFVQFPDAQPNISALTISAVVKKKYASDTVNQFRGTYQGLFARRGSGFGNFATYLELSQTQTQTFGGQSRGLLPPSPRALLGAGYHVWTWRYDGVSSIDFFFDDVLIQTYANVGALTNVQIRDLYLGAVGNFNNTISHALAGEILFYTRGLSNAEVRRNVSSLKARTFADTGITIMPPTAIWMPNGDSLSAGGDLSGTLCYPAITVGSLASPYDFAMRAISGQFIEGIEARESQISATVTETVGRRIVYSLHIGANDLQQAALDVDAWVVRVGAHLDRVRAMFPAANLRIILCTILPASSSWFPFAKQQQANAGLRALVTAGKADKLCDFAADPTMGPASAPSNTTLYADGLHPTATGHTYLKPIMKSAIDGLSWP